MAYSDRAFVKIGDHPFLADLAGFTWRPLPTSRSQVDQGGEPGEQSLSNEGLWRRTARDFILGAGQEFFDEPEESSRLRFWSSKGGMPWKRRAFQQLPTTRQIRSTSATNLELLTVGSRLYVADGEDLAYTTDPTVASPTWTPITGLPAENIADLTTDGSNVYIGYAADEVHKITGAAGSASALAGSPNTDRLQYANGRLIGSDGPEVFEITSTGTKTTIWTHHNASATWPVICPAPNGIYLGLTAGDRSEVYLTTVPDATGALSAPFVVDPVIPDGETLYAATFYGGVIVYLTSRGVRLTQIGGSGYLVHGPAIEIANTLGGAVEGQAEFCWFSWNNFDATSTGLGRLKLDRFTADLVPAYASDLMATAQGAVTSVVTFGDRRYLAVSGVGVYGETTVKVPSTVYSSGWVTYGIPAAKSAVAVEVRHDTLPDGASVAVALEEDDGTTTTVLTSVSGVGASASVSGVDAEAVRVNLTLTPGTDTTTGPVVRRWTIQSLPLPAQIDEIILTLVLKDEVEWDGHLTRVDPRAAWDYLRGLRESKERVPFTFGAAAETVFVDQASIPDNQDGIDISDDREFVDTNVLVRLLTVL